MHVFHEHTQTKLITYFRSLHTVHTVQNATIYNY